MDEYTAGETFEEFKESFSYRSRGDLNFKFLAGFSNEDAARFFQDLLKKPGESIDDGQWDRILAHIYEGQLI